MRLMGCGMIFLCGVMAGFFHRHRLEQAVRDWQELLRFFQQIRTELQSSLRPSGEILNHLRNPCGNCRLLQEYCSAEGSVQQRLLTAANRLTDSAQRRIALRFAGFFGTASAEIQLEQLEHLEADCLEELTRSREIAQKEGHLSVNLGLLAGAAAAILLL